MKIYRKNVGRDDDLVTKRSARVKKTPSPLLPSDLRSSPPAGAPRRAVRGPPLTLLSSFSLFLVFWASMVVISAERSSTAMAFGMVLLIGGSLPLASHE
ncbi:hypothetical protein F2Q68_00044601 [Brassica cretica]|uniref:Uncharacterized protein n=1 Tax=Brassica cretica TaxID=69181 RepID=A0A8S9LS62_BRACR|nr:hypothetical protein F2Q68_00044601 [Brassica cretica]